MNTLQDRIRGSMVGGAVGDALGYPVEFFHSFQEIQDKYGERGITRLDTDQFWLDEEEKSDKAVISDDTQMTLFTANGLLNAARQNKEPKYAICEAYLEWFLCQTGKRSNKFKECWIAKIPELNVRRAPGHTCMSALFSIYRGQEPVNFSKGDGGVMRVAPIPLYAAVHSMPIEYADRLAGDAAEITHLHPLGFIPAALDAHIIYRLALDEHPTRESMESYYREGIEAMKKLYPQYRADVDTMENLTELAILRSYNKQPSVFDVQKFGGGWTGEEALAIAMYCALRYLDNFEEAMIAAVNHAGDTDSTGAITGNILGAALGYEAIPQFYKDDLELHDLILHMADDLYRGVITSSREIAVYLNPDKESIPDKQKRYQQAFLEWEPKSSKTTNKVIATKDRISLQPMEEHAIIPMDIFIPEKAWSVIRCGRISKCMEDHWFMYCDAKTIRYYRSWTGCCVFVASYENVDGGIHISQLDSRRVPNRPNPRFDKEDVNAFLELLMEDLMWVPSKVTFDVNMKKKKE